MTLSSYQWSAFWQALQNTGKWATSWQPSEQDERDWQQALEKYDVFLLDKARLAHSEQHGRYRQPDRGKFLALTKSLAGAEYKDEMQKSTTYWLCYEKDKSGFGRIGQIIELHYAIDTHEAERQSERVHNYLTYIYGGRWMSMQLSLGAVRRKAHELKHEADICIKETCRLCNPEVAAEIEAVDTYPKLMAFLGKTKIPGRVSEASSESTEWARLSQERVLAEAVVVEEEKEPFNPNRLFEQEPDGQLPF